MRIDMRADLAPVHRAMIALGARQVPFASAVALNALAKGVRGVEQNEIDRTFTSPTPFTRNAYRIEVATKSRPVAIVAAKDIQAEYLEPYVFGGDRYLGTKRGMLAPVTGNIALNQYGNLTKGKLAGLKGKPNVFIGAVHTRGGKTINGVWQRPTASAGRASPRRRGAATKSGLKLLIVFKDTTPAPKHLAFYERARSYVRANARHEFQTALQRAFATARR